MNSHPAPFGFSKGILRNIPLICPRTSSRNISPPSHSTHPLPPDPELMAKIFYPPYLPPSPPFHPSLPVSYRGWGALSQALLLLPQVLYRLCYMYNMWAAMRKPTICKKGLIYSREPRVEKYLFFQFLVFIVRRKFNFFSTWWYAIFVTSQL